MLPAWDWVAVYAPAVQALLSGYDPYSVAGFYNPPWTLFPLIPFVLLGDFGKVLFLLLSVAVIFFASKRLGASNLAAALALANPFVLNGLLFGNVESLVILALLVPTSAAIPLLLVKPQMGLLAVAYAIKQKQGRLFAYAAASAAPILVLFPSWLPQMFSYNSTHNLINWSVFPYGLPVAFLLFAYALKYSKPVFALIASPLLFPVLTPQCWSIAFLPLTRHTRASVLVTALVWLGLFALMVLRPAS